MLFLGTAAADVLPNAFCDCLICNEARKYPERGRLRSMFLLDNENLIDCGPDLAAACVRQGVILSSLRNIFVTHTHEDHFCASNAGLLKMSRTHSSAPINVYLSQAGYHMLMQKCNRLGEDYHYLDAIDTLNKRLVRMHPVSVFKSFTADSYQVLPVRTTHCVSNEETAVNYRFTCPNGKTLLYACDTGIYPIDTLDALSECAVDILIMEGTFGSRIDNDTHSHLNATAFLLMLELMSKRGIITEQTNIFATHISHKNEFTHDLYQAWFDKHSNFHVTVAYDGLCIN